MDPNACVRNGSEPVEDRPLLFLHIQKTGGTSLRGLLSNRFPAKACLLDVSHPAHAHTDPNGYQFISGHVGYEYLERFARRPVVLTLLRRPVERAISAYRYYADPQILRDFQTRFPGASAAERSQFNRRANELSQLAFLQKESTLAQNHMANLQTRRLFGAVPPGKPLPGDAELLAGAKHHLEACDLIGLTERLDESAVLFGDWFGWEGLAPVPRDNPTIRARTPRGTDPRALEILTEWNRLDIELYRFAEQVFERRLRQIRHHSGPPRTVAGLPEGTDFGFDQPIHGAGWYERERVGREWVCWMGREREAWLDLKLDGPGERLLQCRVAHVFRRSALDGLQVRINGLPLAVRKRARRSGFDLEARVPGQLIEAGQGRVRLTFSVSETGSPQDQDPDSIDWRNLGIAVSHVRLTPAKSASSWWHRWWNRAA